MSRVVMLKMSDFWQKFNLPQSRSLSLKIIGENHFSATRAKLLSFEAGIVRSPPLVFERKKVTIEGKELEVLDIQDSDFLSLFAKYLF